MASQFLDRRQPPATVTMPGGYEHDRQVRPPRKRAANLGQDFGMKLRGGIERAFRKRADAQDHAQRRCRVSVMPIFSPASAMASLTIFTVTAVIRASWRNSVSQT